MQDIINELKEKYQIWFMVDLEENEFIIQDLTNEERVEKGYEKVEDDEIKDMKSFPLPKKITELWLEKKILLYIEGKSSYKNLSQEFSKIIKDVRFYATTYGLGTHIALDTEEEVRKKIKPVLDKLDKNDIDYKLQYSEGLWVYKIVFSQKKENLEKIQRLGENKTLTKTI